MISNIQTIQSCVAASAKKNPKVRRAYLFGSVARGEDGPDSDIDIALDTDPGFTLVDASGIRLELVDKFGRNVDLINTPTESHRRIYANFENDKVLLYER
jgi:predicted nucleotidyltransferase